MALKKVTVRNLSHPLQSPLSVRLCNTFWLRFMGLMFAKPIDLQGGVLIDEKRDSIVNTSIHMFFMNFDIGAVWINEKKIVVEALYARRWRPFYAPRSPACLILEIHPDRLAEFAPGDLVSIEND